MGHSIRQDRAYLGISLYLGNLILLVIVSGLVKQLTEFYTVSQALFFRYLVVALPMAGILFYRGGFSSFKTKRLHSHIIRTSAGVMSLGLFFYAISKIPIAEATVLTFCSPIFVVMLSIPILGEKIGVFRWSAVIIGFIGMIIIIQPNAIEAVNLGTIAAIFAAMGSAIVTIWLRGMSDTEPVELISTIYNGTGAVVYLVWALAIGWIPILGVIDWTLFVGIGLIAFVQQYLLVSAFRYGEASMIAPFEYTGLIFSAAIGYLFWAEIPTLSTWVGSVIIIASGLVIMTRDKKAKTPGLL